MSQNDLSDAEYIQINQAIFSLRNVFESRMRRENADTRGPTIAEMGVLMVLGQVGRVNARTLAAMMDITEGTVSLYIAHLVRQGLVEQRRDEADRRTWWLVLTDAGEENYRKAYEGTVRYTQDLVASLDGQEQRALHDLLLKLSHSNGYGWQ